MRTHQLRYHLSRSQARILGWAGGIFSRIIASQVVHYPQPLPNPLNRTSDAKTD
jgi:hypothetical protein